MKKYVVIEFNTELYTSIGREVFRINDPADLAAWVTARLNETVDFASNLAKDDDTMVIDTHCMVFETRYGKLSVAHRVETVDGIAIRCPNCDALLEVPAEKVAA